MWVTFGRFPTGTAYEDGDELGDDKGTLSFAWQDGAMGGTQYRFRGFWWYESDMAGVDENADVDWDRYEIAMQRGYTRKDIIEREIATASYAPPDPHGREDYQKQLLEKKLADLPFIDSVHRLYQRQIDKGWSRLFQALSDGSIVAHGWGDLTQDEIREQMARDDLVDDTGSGEGNVLNPWGFAIPRPDTYGPLHPMGLLMDIPAEEWSLSGVAPDSRYVGASGRDWWDVELPCERLLALFPRPLLPNGEERDAVQLLTPALAISLSGQDDAARLLPAAKGTRGRRKKADGEIERACQLLYGRRLTNGEKEAALANEAAHFAMATWGETLSRSTFQEYMQPFKRAVPENVPENAAE
jgi:hypothetical protein